VLCGRDSADGQVPGELHGRVGSGGDQARVGNRTSRLLPAQGGCDPVWPPRLSLVAGTGKPVLPRPADGYFASAVKSSDSVQVGRLVMRCVAVTCPVATRPKKVPLIRSKTESPGPK
jgi:hypothetical protein